MVLRFVDTHCHLDFECFQANLDEVVQEAMAVGVERFLIPGTRASGWAYQRGICERYPSRLFPALGVHPYFVRQHAACSSADLERELTLSNGVYEAIGETGLDGRQADSFSLQQALFELHIKLALAYDLPLLIHAVKAHAEVVAVIKRYPGVRGVIHGFSGSYETAMAYIARGFYLGVGGVILRPTASKTRQALARVPVDHLVLETDSPDMVVPGGKSPNSPVQIPRIFKALAAIRDEEESTLAAQCQENANRLLAWNH